LWRAAARHIDVACTARGFGRNLGPSTDRPACIRPIPS
jgi:hypothetical protein